MNERIALYSTSLYDVAKEENCTESVYESLNDTAQLINDDYVKLLMSASLKGEERENLIDEAFGESVHPYVLNFMKILAKKRNFDIFIPCVSEFKKKYCKDNNIENATITTAVPLSDEKKKDVLEKLERSTGKTIDAVFKVDDGIIGGIIIETETSAIDGSVAGKLRNIERHITKN